MGIEYVPDYDENGEDQGGHTETVPDPHVQEEPDWDDPDSHRAALDKALNTLAEPGAEERLFRKILDDD